jgi:Predicted SPOUT methyltransferase
MHSPSRLLAYYLSLFLLITSSTRAVFVPCQQQHVRQSSTTELSMGLKVTIRIVGRKQGGEAWLDEACDMYLTRLKPSGLEVATEWHKNDAALVKCVLADYDKNAPVVLLDPVGTSCTSETLTDNMYRWLEEGGSRLVFVIGGGTCMLASRALELVTRCIVESNQTVTLHMSLYHMLQPTASPAS